MDTNFLDTLTLAQREELNNISSRRLLTNRETLLNANTSIKNVFVIKSGRVKIYDISDNGKETILWFCFAGEIFGLAELTQANSRKVYAESCGNTELLSISSIDFNNFLLVHHKIALYLIQLLSHRLELLSEQLLNISSDDVSTRLIKLLNRFSRYFGNLPENHYQFKIKLTHQEMGDMIGASRQTVTSTISSLKKSGHLDKHDNLLRLLNTTNHNNTY